MFRGFDKLIAVITVAVALAEPALALGAASEEPEICRPRGDKDVEEYFAQSMKVHESYAFSRPVKAGSLAQMKVFLEQHVNDARTQICSDYRALVVNVAAAAGNYDSETCSRAVVVSLLDSYTLNVAKAYDQNADRILPFIKENAKRHINGLMSAFREILNGNNAGLEGVQYRGYAITSKDTPRAVRIEWVKDIGRQLVREAKLVWNADDPKSSYLVKRNLELAREAVRARQRRNEVMRAYGVNAKMAEGCVPKAVKSGEGASSQGKAPSGASP